MRERIPVIFILCVCGKIKNTFAREIISWNQVLVTVLSLSKSLLSQNFWSKMDSNSNLVWHKIHEKTEENVHFKNFFYKSWNNSFYKFTGTEYSIDNDTKEQSKGEDQDQTKSKNPCQNFCHHGECHLTSFGNPYCKCESNYSGARCEIELCHNFCLNQGFCQISNTGSPNCTCVQGFMGFRCQFHESQSQLCHNFCLNDGLCQLDSGNSEQTLENPQQVCFCPEGFTGRVASFCYVSHTLT